MVLVSGQVPDQRPGSAESGGLRPSQPLIPTVTPQHPSSRRSIQKPPDLNVHPRVTRVGYRSLTFTHQVNPIFTHEPEFPRANVCADRCESCCGGPAPGTLSPMVKAGVQRAPGQYKHQRAVR